VPVRQRVADDRAATFHHLTPPSTTQPIPTTTVTALLRKRQKFAEHPG
jgi:hypothetical protein